MSNRKNDEVFYYLFDESRKRRIRQAYNTMEEAYAAMKHMGTICSVHSSTNPRGKSYERKDFNEDE